MAEEKSKLAQCVFSDSRWNDFEQKNYVIHTCKNPENVGGVSRNPSGFSGEMHGSGDYSCWHENRGMKYRCWDERKKMAECPMFKPKD